MSEIGRVVAVAAAVLVLMGAAPAAAQTTPEAILNGIDNYWAGEFAARGIPYSSPSTEAVTEPIDTPCGTIDVSFAPGAYCPANATVYYVPDFFSFASRAVGEFSTVLAHEWGHHVQWQLGGPPAPPLYELQADCLGGAYLGAAQDSGEVSPGDAAAGLGLSNQAGSSVHGPGNLRSISFIGGYQDGPGACGVGF